MKFFLVVFCSIAILSCAENADGSPITENTNDSSIFPEASSSGFSAEQGISNREEALDFLRSIGMSVFTDNDAVVAPSFEALRLNGEMINLGDLTGNVILLNFWATWCGPCRYELPAMQDLYNDLKAENFVFLAINQQENADIVQDYIDAEGYDFPVILDTDGIINFQYGVRGLPTTYIIGTDGNVLAGQVGTHIFDGDIYRSLFRNLM